MDYGGLVQPIFLADLGWRFVTSDVLDVARRVREEFGDGTRVVGYPDTGDLAVAVWVPRAQLGGEKLTDESVTQPVQAAGGAWCLSFRLRDPATGGPRRSLDADVLDELRRKDTHRRRRGVDPRSMYNELLSAHERREEAKLREVRDKNRAMVEEALFDAARRARVPWNPARIYVPRGVAR
jgi:hypothetical protein